MSRGQEHFTRGLEESQPNDGLEGHELGQQLVLGERGSQEHIAPEHSVKRNRE